MTSHESTKKYTVYYRNLIIPNIGTVARRQALGNRQAEIGIASFIDHAPAKR